jgi:hypothetical protein
VRLSVPTIQDNRSVRTSYEVCKKYPLVKDFADHVESGTRETAILARKMSEQMGTQMPAADRDWVRKIDSQLTFARFR